MFTHGSLQITRRRYSIYCVVDGMSVVPSHFIRKEKQCNISPPTVFNIFINNSTRLWPSGRSYPLFIILLLFSVYYHKLVQRSSPILDNIVLKRTALKRVCERERGETNSVSLKTNKQFNRLLNCKLFSLLKKR